MQEQERIGSQRGQNSILQNSAVYNLTGSPYNLQNQIIDNNQMKNQNQMGGNILQNHQNQGMLHNNNINNHNYNNGNQNIVIPQQNNFNNDRNNKNYNNQNQIDYSYIYNKNNNGNVKNVVQQKYNQDQRNVAKMMELFDKRVQDQKGVHINDNEYQKKEYGSIFSSIYDVHYNNGIRNEKTLKYRKMNEDRFKQQQQPMPRKKTPPKQQQQIQQQPQPQPQPQYDQSAAQMRQLQQQLSQFQQMYQAQLQAQRMREMSEQERLRMADLEFERQKQIQLDLERQVQHEKEAIEYLQRLIELQNQKQVVQEPIVEEEVPDPLQEELERKQQELKMLKEKLHREKLQMTGNSDMYKKMMTELVDNVVHNKNEIFENQNHLNSLLLQIRNQQLLSEQERIQAQQQMNQLKKRILDKEMEEKIRLTALTQALNRTAIYHNKDHELNLIRKRGQDLVNEQIQSVYQFEDGEIGLGYHRNCCQPKINQTYSNFVPIDTVTHNIGDLEGEPYAKDFEPLSFDYNIQLNKFEDNDKFNFVHSLHYDYSGDGNDQNEIKNLQINVNGRDQQYNDEEFQMINNNSYIRI